MTTSWRSWGWRLCSASYLAVGGVASLGDGALAQITPDTTLGSENSTVTSTGSVDQINGGATRGANLFHSFGEFNVDSGRAAYFSNPVGIENILSRVTGANPSNIFGTLGVSGGNANLFLINPNGIIFGPSSRLNVGGSFIATTANAVGLASGDIFSANPGEPLPTALLNVNPNAFLFNQIAAQAIVNRSTAGTGLEVPQGRSLLLVGEDVRLEGGRLQAPGGHVELGGLASPGSIGLSMNDSLLSLSFPDDGQRADVYLTNSGSNTARVNVAASNGGSITITARNIDMSGGSLLRGGLETGLGFPGAQAGDISLRVQGAINIANSFIYNYVRVGAVGSSGDINVTTGSLAVTNGSRLSTSTFDQGNAGSMTILARDIEIVGLPTVSEGNSALVTDTYSDGDAGNLTIQTGQLSVRDGAQLSAGTFDGSTGSGGNLSVNASESIEVIGFSADGFLRSGLFTQTEGTGDAGELTIQTGQLSVREGAVVSAGSVSGREGAGGNLSVTASDSVELVGGADGQFPSLLFTGTEGSGAGGDLTITTERLTVNGARVSAGTFDEGQGGNLTVTASDSVKVIGVSADNGTVSGLFTQAEGTGAAGDLTISTGRLLVQRGAQISASTLSKGRGGTLAVTTSDSVELIGRSANGRVASGLFTSSEGIGNAGDLTIQTGQLSVREGAVVSSSTFGEGQGGNLSVTALEFIEVIGGVSADGQFPSGLFTQTQGTGAAGDLAIQTRQLAVRDRSKVSVGSVGSGQAGNLQVAARSILLDNQGTISAETALGNGGNITLRDLDLLLMRRSSQISTTAGTAGAGGDGGNINIDTDFIVAVPSENSDIIANAFEGNGGNIEITASGIFGTQFREQQTPDSSDINASSRFGVDGVVEINTPDVDPSRGLVNLPTQPTDTEVVQACQPSGSQQQSEFVVTGRGGLPPSPNDTLSSDAIQVDWVTLNPGVEDSSSPAQATNPTSPTPALLVEAQGWVIGDNGEVILTAQAIPVLPHSSWQTPAECRAH